MQVDLKALRQDAGMPTMKKAADEFGVGLRTWAAWEGGEREAPRAVVELLKIKARGLATDAVLVPIVGRINAGPLEMRWETPLGHVEATPRSPHDHLFACIVDGDSMEGAGIMPGDVVVVRQQDTADHGDIVVATVDDEATVKRLRFRQNKPELHAAKEGLEPMRPRPGRELRILGKVIEVRRIYEPRS